ncbi:class I SAM-dependent methyltransferase [Methanolobus sp.]|jgi:protein-L-isoaspartate O-methyltransferase|uniref:class I SAM-dependent methyltransferase n=1 Tax=Methanolobus sp. TaxID=1874737 RepID=UPI0025DCFB97|nr:class I SAM-dependent methyltransferase [Methanolobus sp.]
MEYDMGKRKPMINEIEEMEYYTLMSYLGVPYFHIGGPLATEKLAELCHIDKNSKILMVGCGSGFSACYLAKRKGGHVVGIDIASTSVENARQKPLKKIYRN